MINEIHLRRRGTPDEMVSSFYADVLEVAKKKKIPHNKKEKPLFSNQFYFDDGDKLICCSVQNETKIFQKPKQVFIGTYSIDNLLELIKVDEILFQETYEPINIETPERIFQPGQILPLVRLGLIIKGILNNGKLHLIWNDELNEKIRKWFFIDEKNKQMGKQAKVDLDFSEPKKKKDENDLDFLDAQQEPEKNLLLFNSKKQFDKWFHKRFPQTANLDLSPLMEGYVKTLHKISKYK